MSGPTMDDRFDEAIAALDPAMVLVTTAADGERSGCLVGFHSQSSIEPRRYAVWLSRANHTYGVAVRSEHFAVHFLGEGDHDLAELFGGTTGDDVDKFARCDWSEGPHGVPLLDRCPRRLVCRRTGLLDGDGDHVCFVGAPIDAVAGGATDAAALRLPEVDDIEPGHP